MDCFVTFRLRSLSYGGQVAHCKDEALAVLLAAEGAELKLLHGAPRRGVVMSPCVDQFKAVSERCGEGVRIVAADHQAAAAFRAVGCEGCDDGMSARAQ